MYQVKSAKKQVCGESTKKKVQNRFGLRICEIWWKLFKMAIFGNFGSHFGLLGFSPWVSFNFLFLGIYKIRIQKTSLMVGEGVKKSKLLTMSCLRILKIWWNFENWIFFVTAHGQPNNQLDSPLRSWNDATKDNIICLIRHSTCHRTTLTTNVQIFVINYTQSSNNLLSRDNK